jgi:SAM-dependent methyltransferase
MNNKASPAGVIYLDVGCGHGFKVSTFPKSTINIGVDSSLQNIKVSASRYPKLIFCVMDAHQLGFRPESVSRICIHDVLEHLESPKTVITQLHNVLVIGGVCDVKVPTPNTEQVLSWIRPSYLTEIGHVHIFAKAEIVNLIIGAKFRIESYHLCDVLAFVELAVNFLLARHRRPSCHQVNVFNWRDNAFMFIWHVFLLHFNPDARHTPLRYSPALPFSLILGALIEGVFRNVCAKSQRLVISKK